MTWLAVWTALRKFLAAIPWQVWAAIAFIAALTWFGVACYSAGKDYGRAEVQQDWNDAVAKGRAIVAAKNAKNREIERKAAEQVALAAAKYEQEKTHAIQDARAALLADLHAGRVRLRFDACPRPAGPGRAPAGSGAADAEAELRGEDPLGVAVADSIAIADEADAHIEALQSVIRAYQDATRER